MSKKKFTPMKQWTDNLARTLSTTLPERLGATAEAFYRRSFRNQGFTDQQLVKWRKLKRPRTNSRGKALNKAILKGTGNLALSIRVERADFRGVLIAAGNRQVPYAQIHNEGGWIRRQVTRRAHLVGESVRRTKRGKKVAVRAHMVRRHQAQMNLYMPKRQFMGPSATLHRELLGVADKTMQPYFKH